MSTGQNAAWVAMLLAAVCGGCRTPQSVSPEQIHIGTVTQADQPLTADSIYSLRPGTWTYVDGSESTVIQERQTTDEFEASWKNALGDRRTEFWRTDGEGNIVMTAVIEHDDKAITFFDPPLIIAFSTLEPGASRQHHVNMRVLDEATQSKQREVGTATRTMTYEGVADVETPLGSFSAQVVTIAFHADLRNADAKKSTTLYVVPEYGAILDEQSEHITVWGLPIRDEHEQLRLMRVE